MKGYSFSMLSRERWWHLQLREDSEHVRTRAVCTDPTLIRAICMMDLDLEQITNCPEFGASLGPHPQLSAGPISYLSFVASFNSRSDLSLSSRSKWVLHHHQHSQFSMFIIELFSQTLSSLCISRLHGWCEHHSGPACQKPGSHWRHDLL